MFCGMKENDVLILICLVQCNNVKIPFQRILINHNAFEFFCEFLWTNHLSYAHHFQHRTFYRKSNYNNYQFGADNINNLCTGAIRFIAGCQWKYLKIALPVVLCNFFLNIINFSILFDVCMHQTHVQITALCNSNQVHCFLPDAIIGNTF